MRFKKFWRHRGGYKKIFCFCLSMLLISSVVIPSYAALIDPQTDMATSEESQLSSSILTSEIGSNTRTKSESIARDNQDKTVEENAADTVPSSVDEADKNTKQENESEESDLKDEDIDADSEDSKAEIAESYPALEIETTVEEISLKINAPEGTFPEGTTLEASQLLEGTEAYQQAKDALDENGVTYDGFLGMDISFWFDGNKIEPKSNSVSVEISLNQSLLPGDSSEQIDMSSLSVQHLPEDEEGNITGVETVADMNGEADGTVKAETSTVEASFEVDSFSYITLTYNNGNTRRIYLVDESGNEILGNGPLTLKTNGNDDVNDIYDKWIRGGQWISIEAFADQYGSFTEGYTYQSARLRRYNGTEIKWFSYRYVRDRWNGGSNQWRYSTSNNQPSTDSSETAWDSSNNLYLVFKKNAEIHQTGDLTIQDNISASGNLNATYSGSSDGVTYKWYSSTDSSNWSEVERTKITGSQYNVSEDGLSVNVALDGGARKYYKIVAYDANGNEIVSSEPYQVPYYDALQNGGFENPDVRNISQGGNNYQYPNGTNGLVWRTTGTDNQIEIARDDASSRPHNSYAHTGHQFAELNAEAAGALYQDVLTVPGAPLYWQLSHKARNTTGTDTMYLIIAPKDKVSDFTTQSQLVTLRDNILNGRPGYTAEDGYYIREISDTNARWGTYSGEYEAADYLTRFFFMAGKTASGNNTVGNLLDDVSFSQEVPPPDPGKGNLTVTKTVTGLKDDDIEEYTLPVSVAGTDGKSYTRTLNGFTSSDGGTTYTASYTFTNLPTDRVTYTVSETVNDLQDYELTSTVNGKTGTSVSRVTIPDGKTQSVSFKNDYKLTTMSVTVEKLVTGNMRDTEKDFSFTYSDGNGKTGSFTLKNGGSETIEDLSIGSEITITESDAEEYSTSVTYGNSQVNPTEKGGKTFKITLEAETNNIVVTNHRNVNPPTGIHTSNTVYLAMLAISALLATTMFVFLRRRQ